MHTLDTKDVPGNHIHNERRGDNYIRRTESKSSRIAEVELLFDNVPRRVVVFLGANEHC